MKKLNGIPSNINSGIIGKATRKTIILWGRKNYVLITNEKKISTGYAAIITEKCLENLDDIPLVHSVENIKNLDDGDIVLIEPTGRINILYERSSSHNSLLATERCNCSCIMCPQPKVSSEDDKTHMNLKLISLMDKNTECLGITGGEPTLIGDALLDIISVCKKKLPKTQLNLLTNGIKFENFEYAKKLAMVRHPDIIIDVPLYADTDTEHNEIIKANGFYKTVKGLYNLALFKQKIGMRIVIHRLTYLRLPQIAEFIYHNFPFVYHIAFMQMETIGLAIENIEKLWIDPYDYNDQLVKAVHYLSQRSINVSIYNAQLCILPKNLWKYARKSISSWKNIYLDECYHCDYQENCGGFFESSLENIVNISNH